MAAGFFPTETRALPIAHPHQTKAGLLVVLVALGILLGLMAWTGWDSVVKALGQVGGQGFVVAFALSTVNTGLRFLRWRMYLLILGCRVPIGQSLLVFCAGFALAPTPGNAGVAVRSVFLKHLGVGYPESLAVFLSERLADLLGIVAVAAVAATAFPAVSTVVPFVLLLVMGLPWLLTRRSSIKRWQDRFSVRRSVASRLLAGTLQCVLDAGACFQPGIALAGIVLGMLGILANALSLHYLLGRIGLELPPLDVVFAYTTGIVAGAASLTPAGVGTAEATVSLLLVHLGLPEAGAVASVIAARVTGLWAWVVIGMLAWTYIGWRWRALGAARPA